MVWDADHRKRHKVSQYLGKVRDIVSIRGIYETGHIELVWSLMEDVISMLREEYPSDLTKIIAFSFNRLIDPLPTESIRTWIEKTLLSRAIHKISPRSISAMLNRVGKDQNRQKRILMMLMKMNKIIAYDTSALFSYSQRIMISCFP